MAIVKNAMNDVTEIKPDSNDYMTHEGVYLLFDEKVVKIRIYKRGGIWMLSIKEIYDLWANPRHQTPRALRPLDVARITGYIHAELLQKPALYRIEPVYNHGENGDHLAMEVIKSLRTSIGGIEIAEKRFRFDKALEGSYEAPLWVLAYMYQYAIEQNMCLSSYDGYLKKIEVTPRPDPYNRERPPRALRREPENVDDDIDVGEPPIFGVYPEDPEDE